VRELETGVWLFPSAPAPHLVTCIRYAEALGLHELWLGDEGPARDPLTVLAAAATRTERIRLAVGVTNPYVRHPASTALAMLTIHELSGGRAVLGLGVGGDLALGPFEVAPTAPLRTMRKAIGTMHAVFRGERAEGYAPPHRAPTARTLPLYVGSRSERINRLGSELADGAFVAGLPVSQLHEAVGWARSIRHIPISLYVSAAFEPEDVERARPEMVWPLLNSSDSTIALTGHARSEFLTATQALQSGDAEPARRLMSDDVLRHVLLWGTPAEIGLELAALARTERPDSIGICLLQADVPKALEGCAEAFAAMHSQLGSLQRLPG
jgi:5,10-methylenetetrahydromethanopterin reductase